MSSSVRDRSRSAVRRLSALVLPGSSERRASDSPLEREDNHLSHTRSRGRSPPRRLYNGHQRSTSAFPPSSAPRYHIPTTRPPRRSVSVHDAFHDPLVLLPPPRFHPDGTVSALPSPALSRTNSRPQSAPQIPSTGVTYASPGAQDKQAKRRSWLSSSRGRAKIAQAPDPKAWIIGHPNKEPYNLTQLVCGDMVEELWDERGDTLVYLFPRTSGKGPSFRIHSSIYASSASLTQYAYGDLYNKGRGRSHTAADVPKLNGIRDGPTTPPLTPNRRLVDVPSSTSSRDTRGSGDFSEDAPRQMALYLPVRPTNDGTVASADGFQAAASEYDVEALIAMRNLFAFLVGQSLIATEKRPSAFSIFTKISEALAFYEFSNVDGSTFGEVSASSFDQYADELRLADVRFSREKAVEALVLAERMRSFRLYNEAFVHAAGKYHAIQRIARLWGSDSKFEQMSAITRSRLERASIDLAHREKSVNARLSDFEFPSIFAGVLSSKMADERKAIRFSAWKDAFLATRRHVLSYYKSKYGSWPPKASSRKNDLETSGLNRLVLKQLYYDFARLYDLFVDRTSLTTRSSDFDQEDGNDDLEEPVTRVLRRVLDEYDRSSPPVQPPIPFDTPLLPIEAGSREDFARSKLSRDAKSRSKKLRGDELVQVLQASCNQDTLPAAQRSTFLSSMQMFERKAASGRTLAELVTLRVGMWLFMYAVLQALPMLVIDAPGIKYHEGVEYFLCKPPPSAMPWVMSENGSSRGRNNWYGISGGGGVVSLPSDLVEHGVEGVYRRSHCWIVAQKWTTHLLGSETVAGLADSTRAQDYFHEALPTPPQLVEVVGGTTVVVGVGATSSGRNSRTSSPTRKFNRDSVVGLGLEALPIPSGVAPPGSLPGGMGSLPPSSWVGGFTSRAGSRPPYSLHEMKAASMEKIGTTFDDIIRGIDTERDKKATRKSK